MGKLYLGIEQHINQSNLIEDVRDPNEVVQSLVAWNYLKNQPFLNLSVVLETHRLIMKNLLPEKPGRAGSLRLINVQVGRRLCPHYNEVPDLINAWLLKMDDWWYDLYPIAMHIEFEHIHPFIDGNGRTGRMLLWWHEMKQGQIPTAIVASASERWDYYSIFDQQ